jgi:hypothetical protein
MTMTVREKLREKGTGIAVAASMILLAVIIAGYYLWPSSSKTAYKRAFLSDDDGQTYYVGSIYDLPPIDHSGKTANVAMVYNDGHQNFVAFLQRFKPDARKKLQDILDANKDQPQTVIGEMGAVILAGGMEIKLPGPQNKWVPSSMLGSLHVHGPDGSTDITAVEP